MITIQTITEKKKSEVWVNGNVKHKGPIESA